MMVRIPAVLTAQEVAHCREVMAKSAWVDGKVTAGEQSSGTKKNLQLAETAPQARELGEIILRKLGSNPLFTAAALPLRVYPPLFNRYDPGMTFGTHIDNAIRFVPQAPIRVRTDISATLFLTDPADYDGGELVVEDTYGTHSAKLPAGDMILYPASSRHHVHAVTRGSRWASFFWVQSMVRDDGHRALLLDLDVAVQGLRKQIGDTADVVRLTGLYHNLIRQWSDT